MTAAPAVLLVGHYGAGNIGDDAALAGALAVIREAAPDAQIRVATQNPAQTARTHDVAVVSLAARGELLSAVVGADLVVLGGGGPLFDYGGLDASLVLASTEPWAAYYLVPQLAHALDKAVVMLGQGVGPIAGSGGRDAIAQVVRGLTAATLRDAGSRDLLLSLGADPVRTEKTADLAFQAPQLALRGSREPAQDAYVAVSVRRPVLAGGPSPTTPLAEALGEVHRRHGLRSTLVPLQDGPDGDAALCRELLRQLPPRAAGGLVEPGDGLLERATAAIGGARLVIGMRLHAVVFALAAGVPVIGLSYDPKVRAVLTEAGLAHRCLDVDEITAARLLALVDEVMSDLPEEERAVVAAGARLREAGRRDVAVVRDVVEGRIRPRRRDDSPLSQVSRVVGGLRERALAAELHVDHLQADVLRQHARSLAAEDELEQVRRAAREAERAHAEQVASLAAQHDGELEQLAAQLGRSTSLLRREELTVARPVARRVYRSAQAAARKLSPDAQQRVRSALSPAARLLAPRSPQAAAYAQARRARDAQGRLPAGAVAPRAGQPHDGDHVPRFPPLPPGAPGSFDVIMLPVIDWHFRVQRPQHLATHLARRGHRVIYLTTEMQPLREDSPLYSVLESPESGVWVARIACPEPVPRIYTEPMTAPQAEGVARALRALERDLGLQRIVLLAHHPFWEPLLTARGEDLLVYDLIDDHAGFADTADWVLDAEARLLDQVDLVTVTSPTLATKASAPVLIRNAAEVARFAQRPATIRSGDRPRVGYFGAIAHWFDTALVEKCARAHPDWDFILIGSTYGADVTVLESLPNVELLGELPYDELPPHLHGFDVCLIPFRVIPLTEHTNPVKVYEYLAAGKPVVATAMPEVLLMQPHVHVGRTADEFCTALEAAMAEVGDEDKAEQRRAWAQQHDWDSRAAALERAVDSRFPSVSAIVLCYNNLALTKSCLSSLEHSTQYPHFEVVVVDNASTDGTREYLTAYARDRPHVRLVLNDENLGFAGGNNVGLAAATGDVLVLLNNDTVVTRGWAVGLVRHLRDDSSLGLVGPVTNNIGNEAKVDVVYEGLDALESAARPYTSARFRQLLRVPTVAFFCVAMRREVYAHVGDLDEAFGVGFFEDDDYCRRVQMAGYTIGIAEDVFVHHHLSASFDALGATRKQELFEKNKAVYEAKWGEWTPHVYRAGDRT